MNGSRPAGTTATHHARRTEDKTGMEEIKKGIIQTLDVIEHKTILRMIREIVHWLAAHQDELI